MKTMITRNNVLRHNGTMTCLLGRSGPREFRVITPRHGLLLCGSERKRVGASGSQWKQWKSSGSSGRCQEGVGDREGVRRGAGGPEGRGKVRKRREGMGSNGMLQNRKLAYGSTCIIKKMLKTNRRTEGTRNEGCNQGRQKGIKCKTDP